MINSKLTSTKVKQLLLYSGIALFPFQNLSIKINAVYDLSAIILLTYIVFLGFGVIKKNIDEKIKVNLYFLAFFFVAQLVIFQFTLTPFYRLVSGLVWFGGLLLIILFREKIEVNFSIVYKIIFTGLFGTSLIVFIESFFHYAPKGFFSEPSYAGLALYSMAASYLGCFLCYKGPIKQKINILFLGILFFIAAFLTRSMHIFSFLAVSFFAFGVSFKKGNFSVAFILITAAIAAIFSSDHLLNRLNTLMLIFNESDHFQLFLYNNLKISMFGKYQLERDFNLSSLAWLDGFTQAYTAIMMNPFTGLGLGSSGFFHYESIYDTLLIEIHGSNPNKLDSYSGIFRLFIETGIVLPLVVLISIFKSLSLFKLNLQQTFELLFLRFFSLTLVIGVLIKEPSYSRSIIYVAVLLFATCFIRPHKFKL
jgi:hypothetical protein